MDTAKGIMYFACNLGKAMGQEMKKPLFIAIPSTSGTGSEVTNFTVITSQKEKVCIIDDFIAPDVAILDSSCIDGLPQRIVADTGIDVLVHSIEAYVSKKQLTLQTLLLKKQLN
ncbi:iron-containing alcohol dehydrogenase [Clostridium ljungdahlii]|uniref:iron-containing alcohol dehydrogenase n=1 Tax=Clostridium ljungdahlii TaxID=1538 RepID=UPI003862FDAF